MAVVAVRIVRLVNLLFGSATGRTLAPPEGGGSPTRPRRLGGARSTPSRPSARCLAGGAVAGPLVALIVALGVVATPFVLPASAMKSIGITPGPNQVTNWSSFNYSGYQAQAAYPEYRALIQTMERVGATYGCGQSMWQYDPSLNRFGTTQALMLLPYWSGGLHRLDGGAALRVLRHDAVPLPQPGRAVGHPFRGDGRVWTTRR